MGTPERRSRLAAFAALALGALLAGCASAPKGWDEPPCRRIWVYWDNPLHNHTGLLLPRADFPVPEAFTGPAGADGRRKLVAEDRWGGPIVTDWVEVGFASDLYLEDIRDGKKPDAWRILRGGPGAVFVRPFPLGGDPQDWRNADQILHPMDLPEARYRALLAFVAGSFARDGGGALAFQFTGTGIGAVYLSTYEYSYRRFCNVWALDALRAGGVSISRWMPSSSQVRYWLENGDRPVPACVAKPGSH